MGIKIYASSLPPLEENIACHSIDEDGLPSLTYHDFKISFLDCGEGVNGDFERFGPDDVALLRVGIAARAKTDRMYETIATGRSVPVALRRPRASGPCKKCLSR